MDANKIGEKLSALRGDRNQSEVAKAIGITTSALSNYECGVRIPRDEVKIKLANYYDTTIADLFFTD